jgi:hypothetical protein
MYAIHDDGSETFGIPGHMKVMLWLSEVLFLAMTAAGLAMPWLRPGRPDGFWLGAALVAFFGPLAAYTATVLRRLPEKLRTDDHAITYEPASGEPVVLPWNQVSRIVDRPVLQRIELQGIGGTVVIPVENQIDHFDRLRWLVLERANWRNTGGVPELPARFYRTRGYFLVLTCLLTVVLALNALAVVRGSFSALILFLFVLPFLFDWYAVTVDRTALTLHFPLSTRTIPMDQVQQVTIGTSRLGYGQVMLNVSLLLPRGKTRNLTTVQGGIFDLYRTVAAARGDGAGRDSRA